MTRRTDLHRGEPGDVRVVRGEPSDDELATLAVVLFARAARPATAADLPRSMWRDRAVLLRAPLMPGRGAWRASALPH